ncbi:glycoside hydrolase family 2 protein [Paenibacillus nasutitermitis]|uniref:Beta-mannosidase n=1 Tax=Paenibacillus nasutitermitis TaxID=1652958 RepID=A0A916ZDE2_9BACL|nr:glycoside hydrolase family 2 TIM barrel-domain containing protein [Paenibacillus nasutitermitis]GGD90216.1 hypothetical protein GCM10010911_56090 [Paenibacillus nasutitermitis]
MNRYSLNGTDWTVTGWYPNQWRPELSMELGMRIPPAVQAVQASVPGSVQTDLLAAGLLPDPHIGLNSMHGEWVTQREWVYEKTFHTPADCLQDRCELVLEGLDFAGWIHINGIAAAEFEGMFVPVVIDVTDMLLGNGEANQLKVIFRMPPEVDGQVGYSSQIRKLKSRFNYAWDWCPRMINIGIWRDVYLRTFRGVVVRDFFPSAGLTGGQGGNVDCRLELEVGTPGDYLIRWRIEDPGGAVVWELEEEIRLGAGKKGLQASAGLAAVRLWWPSGMGDQPLYRASAELLDSVGRNCDSAAKRIGFRSVEWVRNPGADEASAPYTALVNGRRLFLRGVNWVPISPYYGSVTAAQYHLQLDRMRQMNANLVRVWGGGIIEKPQFYEYCDRHGLLVWQELLQSSSGLDNCPPDDPQLLRLLGEAAEIAIREKRSHPSLLLWCGGNELMWEGFRPVDERHANIAMLARLVSRLDPGRRFLPASASGPTFCASVEGFGKGVHHDVHGPWTFLGNPGHYEFFNRDDAQFRSETGTAGASRSSLLRSLQGTCSAWPPTEYNPYWVHRGNWWVPWKPISESFGRWEEAEDQLEVFVHCSRFLQKESLRYTVESTRRREPASSGFLIWMGNEPFPNNANTSVLEFDGVPKPAYYAMKQAFSALHVSARYDRAAYQPGESFRAELFLHCDDNGKSLPAAGSLRLSAFVYDFNGGLCAEFGEDINPEGPVILAGAVEFIVPVLPCNVFFLRLRLEGEGDQWLAGNDYVFTAGGGQAFEALRHLKPVQVSARVDGQQSAVWVTNEADHCACEVWLSVPDHEDAGIFEQNGLVLLPSETRMIPWNGPPGLLDGVRLDGFNVRQTPYGQTS